MVYRKLFGVPAWRLRSPFEELERMRNRMDRLIDGFSRGSFETSSAGVFPLINLAEDKDNYYLSHMVSAKSDIGEPDCRIPIL